MIYRSQTIKRLIRNGTKYWYCPRCANMHIFYHSERNVFYCPRCGIFYTAKRERDKSDMRGGEKDE